MTRKNSTQIRQLPKKKKRKVASKEVNFSSVRQLARPDEWAIGMKLRVDGRPFDTRGREFVRQVIRDTSDEIVIPKAAQMAFTVTMLTRTLHWIKERRWNHLYLLPLKTGSKTFVQQRIDTIIDSNEVLRNTFKSVDNVLHKQSIDGNALYIRGTNISSELQEIPVDVEVWDERDRFVEDNLEDAMSRMDGSSVKKLTMLSTPTVPGHGVDAEDAWWASDMHRWFVPCPGCGRFQVFTWEENFKLGDKAEECVLECSVCHREITDEERGAINALGRWEPTNLDGNIRGYHINQFNSPTQTIEKVAKKWFKGQTDARKLRSFYNNSLGLPYVAAGDKITPQILDKCRVPGYSLGGIPDGAVFLGIDIGNVIHVLAYTLNRHGQRQLYGIKTFREWHELDNYLSQFTNFMAVCDAHPEKRAARDLSLKYPGKFWLGFELDRPQTQEIAVWHPVKYGEAGKCVIDRTMAFDSTINQFMNGNVLLPPDARELGELMPRRDHNGFYHQLIQMVRVEEEDTQGRMVARWKKNKNPDHWHHADMFAFIASLKKPSLDISSDILSMLEKGGSLVGAS
jgi:hypothetical protein